jgi:hypothetical protein
MMQPVLQPDPTEVEVAFEAAMADAVACPECESLAVVEWRSNVSSTGGPVEHLKVRCLNRHWFLMPAEVLDS